MFKKSLFGTDGIRGKIGDDRSYITPKMMTKLGWAVGKIIQKNQKINSDSTHQISVMVGKDTRISGYMLESALEAGLIASGVNVYLVGPMPTPAIAYLTKTFSCDIGIAITASHNPFTDNGIKFFTNSGEKLSDQTEAEIESLIKKPMTINPAHLLGKAFRIDDSAGRYIEFCKSSFPMNLNLEGIKLVIDCANGATYHIAPSVFKELGANVVAINNEPNGLNINHKCGSNEPGSLVKAVLKNKADLGIAFDGDGDRICVVDHLGNLINGDGVIYILAKYLHSKKALKKNTVIGTKMTNFGLEKALNKMDLTLIRCDVGDRYIRQKMKETESNLGGESSGHIIYSDYINTGDAIIASLQILKIIKETQMGISNQLQDLILYPSLIKNIEIPKNLNTNIAMLFTSEGYKKLIEKTENELKTNGRILIRPSGTEPVLRVMVECADKNQCEKTLKNLVLELNKLISSLML